MASLPTNLEILEKVGLPADIIDSLKTAQGTEFTAKANEFLTAIVNKIVYQEVHDMEFSNPFKKYDSYPVTFGDTIEEIFVEMPTGHKFNPDATNPFAKSKPTAKAFYSTVNYEMQYKITVEDKLLRRACLNEYGFMNLINSIIAQLVKAMSIDEYYATIGALNNADNFAKGYEQIVKASTDSETAEKVTKEIVNGVSYMALPNTAYNKAGVLTASKKGDILLIIKSELLNKINLDYLAGVYNLSKVDLLSNIVEVQSFQTYDADKKEVVGEDIDFMLVDTKGFDNHVALQDGGLIYNPEGKYTNHYTNLWKIISFKLFYNARAFKLVEASA